MNTKLIVLLGGVGVAHLVVGGLILTGGCAQEDPPMPPGIYVPKPGPAPAEPGAAPANQPATAPTETPAATPAPAAQDPAQDEPIAVPPEPKQAKKAQPADDNHGGRLYIVVKNDSLWLIARKNGLTIEELANYNNLSPRAKLKVGQKLYIPAAGKKAVKNKPRKGKAKAAAPSGKKGKKGVKSAGKGKSGAKGKLPEDGIYTVKAGDNFSFIAKRYGLKVSDIQAANPGVNSNRLHIGQKLRLTANAAAVPKKAASKAVKAKKAAASKKAAEEKPVEQPAAAAAPAAENNDQPVPADKKADEPAEKKSEPTTSEADSLLNTVKPPSDKADGNKAQDGTAPDSSVKAVVPDAKDPLAVVPDDDTVITGKNSKTTVIIGKDTTLSAFCDKFKVSPQTVRQQNASIPGNGRLKKGMRISLIGDDDPAI